MPLKIPYRKRPIPEKVETHLRQLLTQYPEFKYHRGPLTEELRRIVTSQGDHKAHSEAAAMVAGKMREKAMERYAQKAADILCQSGMGAPAQPDALLKHLIEIDKASWPGQEQKHVRLGKAIEPFKERLIESGIITIKDGAATLNMELAKLVYEKVKY